MFRGLATVLLLVVSNAFMTLAWYGHIAFKSRLERFGLTAIVLLSWGIALFEYCFQVPANRIGQRRIRRSVLDLGTEGDSGGRIALGLHRLRAGLYEIRHPALEPPRGIPLPGFSRLFHFPQIAPALRPSRRGSGAKPADRLRRPLPPFYRKQAFDRRRIEAVFDDLGRNASDDGIGRHIARHNGP